MLRPALALLVGLAACDAAEPRPDALEWVDGTGVVDVELGIGVDAFAPILDGAVVDVITGIQGGYHIWVTARVAASEVAIARFYVETRFADDGAPAGPSGASQGHLELQDTGFRDRVGIRAFVTDPRTVRGRRIAIQLDVTCPDGRQGTSQRIVVPK